jgi:hypothetical protein
MSLKNAILPDVLIVELYKNVFILGEPTGANHKSAGTEQLEAEVRTPEMNPVSYSDAGGSLIKHAEVSKPEKNTVKFLGNNSKKILIIVRHPEEVFLPERHLEFLIRLLAACKLNIGDVAIVNDGYRTANINILKQQLSPDKVILFGIDPTEIQLPLTFPQFKMQNYANSTYLSVPSLDILNHAVEDKLIKTKLWVCLKSMFGADQEKHF